MLLVAMVYPSLTPQVRSVAIGRFKEGRQDEPDSKGNPVPILPLAVQRLGATTPDLPEPARRASEYAVSRSLITDQS